MAIFFIFMLLSHPVFFAPLRCVYFSLSAATVLRSPVSDDTAVLSRLWFPTLWLEVLRETSVWGKGAVFQSSVSLPPKTFGTWISVPSNAPGLAFGQGYSWAAMSETLGAPENTRLDMFSSFFVVVCLCRDVVLKTVHVACHWGWGVTQLRFAFSSQCQDCVRSKSSQ